MKQFGWACLVLLLAMIIPGTSTLAQEQETEGDALDKLMEEGWTVAAPGVMQRQGEGNKVETFAVGPEGLRWVIQELSLRVAFLKREYRTYKNEETRRAIVSFRGQIAKLRRDLSKVQDEPLSSAAENLKCGLAYDADAEAEHLTTTTGVRAIASAYFQNGCGYSGEAFATVTARATKNGITETITRMDPGAGSATSSISASVTATVEGTVDCYAEAYSYARYAAGNIFHSSFDTHSECPAPSTSNPFTYNSAYEQKQACYAIATRNTSYCSTISDFNDRQMCNGVAGSVQSPCSYITDSNLKFACYGMATRFGPTTYPSYCANITNASLQSFCYGVSHPQTGYCYGVTDPDELSLCLGMAGANSSVCSSISTTNERSFCTAVMRSSPNSSHCANIW